MAAPYVKRHTRKFIKSSQPLKSKKNPVIDFQDVEMYIAPEGETERLETKEGRGFTRWVFKRRLGVNQTGQSLQKLRRGPSSAFFLRYNYAAKLVKIET